MISGKTKHLQGGKLSLEWDGALKSVPVCANGDDINLDWLRAHNEWLSNVGYMLKCPYSISEIIKVRYTRILYVEDWILKKLEA